jgi:DNA-binding transcriptional regulator YiaG
MATAKVERAAEPKQIRRKAATKREVREIPASQFGRVRTLTKYGMTQAQVAELYGVTVQEIERIIGRSGPLA